MSEIDVQTENPSQEAATTESSVPFWEQMDNETSTESTPEPAAEAETTEAPDTEAQESETEADTETEEDADDYLPTEQEKVFPIDVLAKYAKRYGYTLEEIQADPRIQNALKDKINSDVLIRQQMQAQQQQEEEAGEEPPLDQQPQAAAAAQVPQDRTQWLEQVVNTSLDPKAVETIGHDFLVACGVDPEADGSKDILANSGKVGSVLAKGALDMFTTIAPQMQMQMLESAMPGITEMYQRNLYALQWDRVSSSVKDANLPKYGTPEFQTAVRAAAEQIPGFEQMVFTDNQGRPLPPNQQIEKQYGLLAKQMSGQKVTPQEVKAAIDKGKQIVKDADRSRAAGKVLGAGQSKRQFAAAPKDDFQSMIAEYNASQRSTPIKG